VARAISFSRIGRDRWCGPGYSPNPDRRPTPAPGERIHSPFHRRHPAHLDSSHR